MEHRTTRGSRTWAAAVGIFASWLAALCFSPRLSSVPRRSPAVPSRYARVGFLALLIGWGLPVPVAARHAATEYTGAPFNFCLPGYDSYEYEDCWDFNWSVFNASATIMTADVAAAVAATSAETAARIAADFTIGASTKANSTADAVEVARALAAEALLAPLTGAGTSGTWGISVTGNAGTATALAADGANCSAASFPLGIDASGAVQSCTTLASSNAGTATALAGNGANCAANSFPLGVDASGAVENCSTSISGNAATVTTNANLTGDVTSVGNATTLTNAPVIAKVLTGYVSGSGTISASDSILSAFQKVNGNVGLTVLKAGDTMTGALTMNPGDNASYVMKLNATTGGSGGTQYFWLKPGFTNDWQMEVQDHSGNPILEVLDTAVYFNRGGVGSAIFYSTLSLQGLMSGGGNINITGAAGIKGSSFTATYGIDAASGTFGSGATKSTFSTTGALTLAPGAALSAATSSGTFGGISIASNTNTATDYALMISSGYAAFDTWTESISTMGASSVIPANTIYWSSAAVAYITLNNSPTWTFANAKAGQTQVLIIKQDGTGSRTVTWPTITWTNGGTAPTLTTTANKRDSISIFYDGAEYFGYVGGQGF